MPRDEARTIAVAVAIRPRDIKMQTPILVLRDILTFQRTTTGSSAQIKSVMTEYAISLLAMVEDCL